MLLLLLTGLACRWEAWDYYDSAGASVFRYRGVLLPWQDAQAPAAGVKVSSVTVQKWSYYGLNRFDHTGAPGAVAAPTASASQSPPR